jgi:hypothetical protein
LVGDTGILLEHNVLEHNVEHFVADAEAIYAYERIRQMSTPIIGRAATGLGVVI